MDTKIKQLAAGLALNPGLSEAALQEFSIWARRDLPPDYLQFLRISNGAEGPIGPAGYLMLWPIERIPEWNQGYCVDEFAPGLILIGSNSGTTAYGLYPYEGQTWFVELPFICTGPHEFKPLGTSFLEFLERLANET
jgi:hypothetical protein